MSFWRQLGKVAGAAIKIATPVVIAVASPESLINTAVGTVVKHGMSKVPNNTIPYLNLAVSTAVAYGKAVASTGDWDGSILPALQAGGIAAAASTALPQTIKLPLRELITGSKALRVGPGEKFSF